VSITTAKILKLGVGDIETKCAFVTYLSLLT